MTTRTSYRRSTLSILVASTCSLVAAPTWAAEEESAQEENKVIVTGSRIRQVQTEGVAPILTLTREDIDKSGMTSIADLLQRLPAAGSALNSRYNSSGNFGMPSDGGGVGAGSAEVDLRNLSSKRTLVLVDGKRWVNNSSASGLGRAVDLNTIPVSVIERVEILEDGASSIYGSDAIAGVVNIITRKDFDGAEISFYGGQYGEGDGETTSVEMSFGSTSDKHSFFLSLSHKDQEEVSAADRSLASTPKPGGMGRHGSSATPGGRFLFSLPGDQTATTGSICSYDAAGDETFCNITADGAADSYADFHAWSNADRFNYAQFNLYVTPNSTTNIFAQGTYELTSDTNFNYRAMYNSRESKNQAAPEPMFIGPDAGTGNAYADNVVIDVTNPYNPFGATLDSSNFIFAGRRPIEAGPREYFQDVDTYHFGVGLDGVIDTGDNAYYWDANWSWSENQASQIKHGALNARRISLALGPVAACNADPLCVPLDIFGVGSITQEMLDYISFVQHDFSKISLQTFSANISGDITELPAGALSFAAGVEHRVESGSFEPDPIASNGETMGIPASPTSGEVTVDEYFLEANIPLIADASMAKELTATFAVRSSDYDTSGSETTGKFGILWRPTDDLLIRATSADGFRAPSIAELFATGSRSDVTLTDPCDYGDSGDPQNTAVENACTAIWSNISYPAFLDINASQVGVNTGGNQNLQAETSESMTFGMVYDASWADSWADSLTFSLNFYEHEIDNAIQSIDPQTQLDACVAGDSSACTGISRGGVGAINGFNNALVNIGTIETSGYDFTITYAMPESEYGKFSFIWRNTIIDEYIENGGANLVGMEFGSVPDRGIPEWKYDLIASWRMGNMSASWTMHWVDELLESCSDFLDGHPTDSLTNQGLCSIPDFNDNSNSMNVLDDVMTHDVQFTYETEAFGRDTIWSVGIQNLLDEDPPACTSCDLNGYDPGVHHAQGRFGYFRVKVKL
ncbi:MAG: TonB-dependent receptor [Kangiellaceae bacterium]|nr:TonB-dependent receptor [Kangiellaceae bacterium]